MTPEQRAEHITREEREEPKGDGYWFDADHLRVVEIMDLTSRIAAAIRAAVEAERAKYRALLKAVDRVTFLHWNSHEWSQSRMETAMEVLLNARKELP